MSPITKNPDEGFKPAQPGQQPAQPPRAPMPPHAAGAPTTGKPPDRDRERDQREQEQRREQERKQRERDQNERQREHGQAQDDRQKDRDQRGGGAKPREDKSDRPEPGYDENQPVEYTPNIPPPVEKDKQWQQYAIQAANGLYPRLRSGDDYAIGRRTWDGDIELLDQAEGVNIDWGKIVEAAKKLVAKDPYADYAPKPGLSTQTRVEAPGEFPPRRGDERPSLPQDVSVSEANPHLDGNREKHLTQPYVEGQVAEDQHEEEDERR